MLQPFLGHTAHAWVPHPWTRAATVSSPEDRVSWRFMWYSMPRLALFQPRTQSRSSAIFPCSKLKMGDDKAFEKSTGWTLADLDEEERRCKPILFPEIFASERTFPFQLARDPVSVPWYFEMKNKLYSNIQQVFKMFTHPLSTNPPAVPTFLPRCSGDTGCHGSVITGAQPTWFPRSLQALALS